MSTLSILLLVILAVAVIAAIMAISSRNSINQASNQVDEAYSTMDVYLKKRHDLIPNLVKTAQAYATHETEALQQIANASLAAANANTFQQAVTDEQKLDGAANRLFAIAQAYPDLKANQNFTNLMNQLQNVEEDIANSRKYYNASVREYNNKISTFPGSLFASGKDKKPYFQVSSEAERQNVNVDF